MNGMENKNESKCEVKTTWKNERKGRMEENDAKKEGLKRNRINGRQEKKHEKEISVK